MASDQARQTIVHYDTGQLRAQNKILASNAAIFLEQPALIQNEHRYYPSYALNNNQLVDVRLNRLSQMQVDQCAA